MREMPPDEINKRDNNRAEMLKKFQLTRQSCKACVLGAKDSTTTFLNTFLRLKDMNEVVSFLLYTVFCYQYDKIFFQIDDEFFLLKQKGADKFTRNWAGGKNIVIRGQQTMESDATKTIFRHAEESSKGLWHVQN